MGVKDLQDLKKLSMLRSQIDSRKVEEIMNTDYPTLGPDDRIVDALSVMRSSGLQDIPVMDDGDYVGIVSYGAILKKKNVTLDTKLKGLMTSLPSVSTDAKITQVAEMMVVNNCRQLPVFGGSKKKPIGLISRSGLTGIAVDVKGLKEIKVWEVMSNPVEYVKENAMLDDVLEIMRGLDIRTVPVINDQKHVVGIVGMKEIIEHNWKDDNRTVGDLSGKSSKTQLTVGTVCATAPKSVSWDDNLGEAASVMMENSISTLPVLENNEVVGVLTQYDVIELMSACREREMLFIQISGLDDDDKSYTDSIHECIEDEVVKISKIYKPESMTMHVAKYNDNGGLNKYSISARLVIDGTVVSAKEVGWDLVKTSRDLMKKITEIVFDLKDSRASFRKRKK